MPLIKSGMCESVRMRIVQACVYTTMLNDITYFNNYGNSILFNHNLKSDNNFWMLIFHMREKVQNSNSVFSFPLLCYFTHGKWFTHFLMVFEK